MTTVSVSERGQISIPASARKRLGIRPKSKVSVEVRDNEIVIKPVRSISEVAGIFREYAKGKTTNWDTIRNEAMKAVAEEIENETRR